MWKSHAREASPENPHCYLLYTVNGFRITNETVVYGPSAQAVVDLAIENGYLKAEASPLIERGSKAGDTASIDTRKKN